MNAYRLAKRGIDIGVAAFVRGSVDFLAVNIRYVRSLG